MTQRNARDLSTEAGAGISKSIPRLYRWRVFRDSIWILWAGWFLYLILPQLKAPVIGWGSFTWETALTIALSGYERVRFFYLPPLYTSFIAASVTLFGASELSARLPGVVSVLAMPFLIAHIVGACVESRQRKSAFLLACGLCLTAPAVIQGALVIDHPDTHLTLAAVTLFYLAFFKSIRWRAGKRLAVLGAVYSLCLWSKITTALAIPLAGILAGLICRQKREAALVLGASLIGAVLFLVSWAVFCRAFAGLERFSEPFSYYLKAARDTVFQSPRQQAGKILFDLVRVALWSSPLLLLLAGGALIRAVRGAFRKEYPPQYAHLAAFVIVLAAGYGYANATFSGFPKYILPAAGILACLCSCVIAGQLAGMKIRIASMLTAGCVVLTLLFLHLFVGDAVYAQYLIRAAQFSGRGPLAPVFTAAAQQAGVFVLSGINCALLKRGFGDTIYRSALVSLLLVLFSSNIYTACLQRDAGYSVNYAYGTRGAGDLRDYLNGREEQELWSSIEGFLVLTNGSRFHGIPAEMFNDAQAFEVFVRTYAPAHIVLGLAANTAFQLRMLGAREEFQQYLSRHYRLQRFGDYHLYTRLL